MDIKARLGSLLRDNGYSLTHQRIQVFEALTKYEEPVTVVQLARNLSNVDKVSVYRTVDVFEKIGVIHRVWTGFKSKIELSDIFSSHHHHFICIKCGKTIGLESEKLEQDLKDFEQKYGFELIQHSVELSGHCQSCKIRIKL